MNIYRIVAPFMATTLSPTRVASSSLILFIVLLSSPVVAQDLSPRPVARLIGATPSYSRPRRVNDSAHVPTVSATSAVEATPTERRAFEITNQNRMKNGLAPLAWDHELCRMARAHSQDMVTHGFFSHETPAGLRVRDRARAVGIPRFRVLGENIAYNQGYEDPGAFAVERWMTSSGHRANILSSEFESSAVGVFVASDGTVYLTQVFITR